MAKEKTISYNSTERAIIKALKEAGTPLTLAEISEATNMNLCSGNIIALINNKGNVRVSGKREIETVAKKTVSEYELLKDENGVPYEYEDEFEDEDEEE